MASVVIKNLSKNFEEKSVLKNIDLKINDKEFCVLVGPSGCGKSTLLRIIAGLETESGGEIYFDSNKVNNIQPKDRDIAFVFQSYALYPHLSVYDNIAFSLKIKGYKKEIIKEKVEKVSKILGLEELLSRKPKELSGGQRQRVALGRAIVREPKIFLMDEPLSNLDAKLRVQMRAEIKKLQKSLNTTCIYVTHDQVEAMTMGDRVVVLQGGKIQQEDTPENIYKFPKNVFTATFMGSLGMNILDISKTNDNYLYDKNKNIEFINTENNIFPNLDEFLLGFRPDDVIYNTINEPLIKINVNIDFVESLGSHKIIHFILGENKCSLKAPCDINLDKEITFFIKIDKLHFFDKLTQNRI